MNIRIISLSVVFACATLAQKPEVVQEQLEQVKQENVRKETIKQKIDQVIIGTAPIWVPLVTTFFLDKYRGQLCDALCEKIDPNNRLDCGIIHINTKAVARTSLEAASRLGLYALLQGSFENGSFKFNVRTENRDNAFWATTNFVMLNYAIPNVFKNFNATLSPFATSVANFAPYYSINQSKVGKEFVIKTFGRVQLAQEQIIFEKTELSKVLKKVVYSSWFTYMYYPQVKAFLNKSK